MHRILEVATDPWGVHVDRVEVKDVRLPQQMQRAMAAEAEATRDARAKARTGAEGRAGLMLSVCRSLPARGSRRHPWR